MASTQSRLVLRKAWTTLTRAVRPVTVTSMSVPNCTAEGVAPSLARNSREPEVISSAGASCRAWAREAKLNIITDRTKTDSLAIREARRRRSLGKEPGRRLAARGGVMGMLLDGAFSLGSRMCAQPCEIEANLRHCPQAQRRSGLRLTRCAEMCVVGWQSGM
ncbi:hypothetical protein D3C86_1318120 [compost metagenome]